MSGPIFTREKYLNEEFYSLGLSDGMMLIKCVKINPNGPEKTQIHRRIKITLIYDIKSDMFVNHP
jgi:hypothetical protein